MIDLQGREVAVLASGDIGAGRHEVLLEASHGGLAPGLYFARLQVAGKTLMRRFVMTR